LIKLRASDGTILGRPHAGDVPWGITFDGLHIWVSNIGNSVVRLRPGNGMIEHRYQTQTGANPRGILFDGTSIWVANELDNTVTKITPTLP